MMCYRVLMIKLQLIYNHSADPSSYENLFILGLSSSKICSVEFMKLDNSILDEIAQGKLEFNDDKATIVMVPFSEMMPIAERLKDCNFAKPVILMDENQWFSALVGNVERIAMMLDKQASSLSGVYMSNIQGLIKASNAIVNNDALPSYTPQNRTYDVRLDCYGVAANVPCGQPTPYGENLQLKPKYA